MEQINSFLNYIVDNNLWLILVFVGLPLLALFFYGIKNIFKINNVYFNKFIAAFILVISIPALLFFLFRPSAWHVSNFRMWIIRNNMEGGLIFAILTAFYILISKKSGEEVVKIDENKKFYISNYISWFIILTILIIFGYIFIKFLV